MQRIVIDTNVLVSALIQRSYPYLILSGVFTDTNIELCVSDKLLEEYYEVLQRKKFARFPEFVANAQTLLADIEKCAKKYNPTVHLKILSDKDDNKFLELAETCKADFLITGNHNDFTMKTYKRTKIVSPKEYWDENYNKLSRTNA